MSFEDRSKDSETGKDPILFVDIHIAKDKVERLTLFKG
jgi:hypothetical protein